MFRHVNVAIITHVIISWPTHTKPDISQTKKVQRILPLRNHSMLSIMLSRDLARDFLNSCCLIIVPDFFIFIFNRITKVEDVAFERKQAINAEPAE